ncbi:MAG: phosphotransferase [Gordonia paraffinivorans]
MVLFGLLAASIGRTLGAVDHEDFARAALPSYGRPAGSLRLLSVSENAMYLVEPTVGEGGAPVEPLVLRVHRPGYHSAPAIESELAWMRALGEQTDIVTPRLVPALDGTPLVAVRLGDEVRHVAAFAFIPGCTAEESTEDIGFVDLGRITAVMHRHAREWVPPQSFTRFRWDVDTTLGPSGRWGDWRAAPGMTPALRAEIEPAATEVVRRLREFGDGPDRFGLVHADLRLANLMVDDARSLTVIDFDDCGWSWYLADLAAVVSWIETTPEAERIVRDWLTGYLDIAPLPREHLRLVPTFVMLRRLMLTAWIGTHRDAGAAIAVAGHFAAGTAELARRYLHDTTWMAVVSDVLVDG